MSVTTKKLSPQEQAIMLLQKGLAESVNDLRDYYNEQAEALAITIGTLSDECVGAEAGFIVDSLDSVTKGVAELRLNVSSMVTTLKTSAKVIKQIQGPSDEEKAKRAAYQRARKEKLSAGGES